MKHTAVRARRFTLVCVTVMVASLGWSPSLAFAADGPADPLLGSIADPVQGTVGQTVETVSSTVDTATDPLPGPVDQIADATSDTVDGVSDTTSGLVDNVSDTVSDPADAVSDTVSDPADAVSDTVDTVSDNTSGTVGAVSDAASGTTDAVGGVAGAVGTTGSALGGSGSSAGASQGGDSGASTSRSSTAERRDRMGSNMPSTTTMDARHSGGAVLLEAREGTDPASAVGSSPCVMITPTACETTSRAAQDSLAGAVADIFRKLLAFTGWEALPWIVAVLVLSIVGTAALYHGGRRPRYSGSGSASNS